MLASIRSTSRRGRVLVALPVLSLLLVACGDGGGSEGATDGASAPAAEEVPAAIKEFLPGTAASGEPVRLALIVNEGGAGVNQPETGDAAEAVVKYANEHLGGIAGRPIEIALRCATKEDPASARDCANQAVEQKVAGAVITSTGQGLMATVLSDAGIPYISASGGSAEELTSKNSFLFTGGFPAAVAAFASYTKREGGKNLENFVIDVPAAIGGAKALGEPSFKAAGVGYSITAIAPGTPDATPQVSAALKKKPDVVAVVGESTVCTSVLKALETLGSDADRLIIQPCLAPEVVEAAKSAMEGAKAVTPFAVTTEHPEAQLYRYVMETYAPDVPAEGYAAIGYQGMLGLVRGLAGLTGDVTAETVIAKLRTTRDIPVPAGEGTTFSCSGQVLPGLTAVCGADTLLTEIKDGKPGTFEIIPFGS